MTLIVAATGAESIWMLADRRLSYPNGVHKDNGRKIFSLETKDGKALLGYAGLGATGFGNELSEWMANTVRGLNLPLEQVLNILAQSVSKRLPSHLKLLPFNQRAHNIIVIALVDNHPQIYSIDLSISNNKKDFRFSKHITGKKSSKGDISPRMGLQVLVASLYTKTKNGRRSC